MSVTILVPAAVPSLTHSSRPWTPSSALKKTRLPTRVSSNGSDPRAPGAMSSIRTVPAAVPSLFHSSLPEAPSSAVKNSSVPTAAVAPPQSSVFWMEEP
jgi:hypothetical protein